MRFGRPRAPDNVRTVALAVQSHVMDYFPQGRVPPVLRDAPGAWLRDFLVRRVPAVIRAFVGSADRDFALLAAVLAWLWRARRAAWTEVHALFADTRLGWVALVPLAQLGAVALTGYSVQRYFAQTLLLAGVVALLLLCRRADAPSSHAWRVVALALAFWAPVRALAWDVLPGPPSDWGGEAAHLHAPGLRDELRSPAQYAPLLAAIGPQEGARVLVVRPEETSHIFLEPPAWPQVDPFRFGALTGVTTLPSPWNLDADTCAAFVRERHVTHVYDPSGPLAGWLGDRSLVVPTSLPGLYRVVAAR
jgi:hypothetical protein